MTDRHKGYIVVLEDDLREDDGESTLNAIRQIRGVLSVEPVVADMTDHFARSRVRHELTMEMLKVINPDKKQS